MNTKIGFIFPGQGVQKVGMGKDFFDSFSIAKETFEEANDVLGQNLSKIIFEGPQETLTRTDQSQIAIFVTSFAFFRVFQDVFPEISPHTLAGLSLGEYTALAAGGYSSFHDILHLVKARGELMSQACETTPGTMAVIMGLDANSVYEMIYSNNFSDELWIANLNCPGQIVLSGTLNCVEKGTQKAKKLGAKRVIPLDVHGAFHSGLMKSAEEKLSPYVQSTRWEKSPFQLVMNVTGDYVEDLEQIKINLIKQVTNSVLWEKGITSMTREGVVNFIELGPGKTLAGMNRRIGIPGKTISIENVDDLSKFEEEAKNWLS